MIGGVLSHYFDIVFALVLVLVVVITFVIGQIGLLPKRSLPFVAAALLAVFAVAIYRARRQAELRKELAQREAGLKEKEEELKDKKEGIEVSERELNEVQAQVNAQKAAYRKEILIIGAQKREEIDKIDRMTDEEVFRKYLETFGGNG